MYSSRFICLISGITATDTKFIMGADKRFGQDEIYNTKVASERLKRKTNDTFNAKIYELVKRFAR